MPSPKQPPPTNPSTKSPLLHLHLGRPPPQALGWPPYSCDIFGDHSGDYSGNNFIIFNITTTATNPPSSPPLLLFLSPSPLSSLSPPQHHSHHFHFNLQHHHHHHLLHFPFLSSSKSNSIFSTNYNNHQHHFPLLLSLSSTLSLPRELAQLLKVSSHQRAKPMLHLSPYGFPRLVFTRA